MWNVVWRRGSRCTVNRWVLKFSVLSLYFLKFVAGTIRHLWLRNLLLHIFFPETRLVNLNQICREYSRVLPVLYPFRSSNPDHQSYICRIPALKIPSNDVSSSSFRLHSGRQKELLERFELDPKSKIKKMSKGMKQKLGWTHRIYLSPGHNPGSGFGHWSRSSVVMAGNAVLAVSVWYFQEKLPFKWKLPAGLRFWTLIAFIESPPCSDCFLAESRWYRQGRFRSKPW